MKKVITLTERDLRKIVNRVISEQREDKKFTMSIQKFLNKKLNMNLEIDGKTGSNSETEKAISKYQSKIGVYPADGVWGPNTWDKMPPNDKKLLKSVISEDGDIFDRFINWVSSL